MSSFSDRGDQDWSEATTKVIEHYDGHANTTKYGWQSIKCVNPDHDDSHASARVNLTIGAYFCNSCELRGDLIGVVKFLEGTDYASAVVKLQEIVGDSSIKVRRIAARKQRSTVLDEPWNKPTSAGILPTWISS